MIGNLNIDRYEEFLSISIILLTKELTGLSFMFKLAPFSVRKDTSFASYINNVKIVCYLVSICCQKNSTLLFFMIHWPK